MRDKRYVPGPGGNHSTFWGFQAFTVPYWFLSLASGGVAAAGVVSQVRRRTRRGRARRGLCPSCGYDVRATPDRCPECGAVPAARAV